MTYLEYLHNKRDYQEQGALFLIERKHACLFYKPGKGKTYPCIEALRDVVKDMEEPNVLILSTADAIKNMWRAEILPQGILPNNTITISFTSAIQEHTKVRLLETKWDVIIIDECHKIKSHNSQISKLVYRLARRCPYVWGLSGTPRGNNDIDIFCQFHNMWIADWGTIAYSNFIDKYCDIDVQYFQGQQVKKPIGISKNYKAAWDTNVAMYTQRVEYSDEDDMPDLNVNEVKFKYTPTKEYTSAKQGCIQLSNYESTMTKLSAIQKLHQAVNGFLYYPDPNDDDKRLTYIIEQPNKKIEWLDKNINISEPTVIVYRFTQDFEWLSEHYKDLYTEDIDEFKQQCGKTILLLQCSRCESFNLQMCKHMVFYTLDYSYIKYNQMLHRVWRMGQDNDVTIDILLYDGTVETKIWNSVKNKEKLADLFMSIKGDALWTKC